MGWRVAELRVARTLDALRAGCAALAGSGQAGRDIAFVPTMGALHAGHAALVDTAVASGAAVVASIFVNPLQFAAGEDLSRYPRTEDADLALLAAHGCRLVWLPDAGTMYPADEATMIEMAGPALGWEGTARPGHFRGVATVVAKLFGQVRPDTAYFGEKDWQQLQVVTRMAADLLLPVRILGVPTVRDTDGLALSSRNRFLSAGERATAAVLPHVLRAAADALGRGAEVADTLTGARAALAGAGFAIDYLDMVDGPSLRRLARVATGCRVLTAARLGSVRLLDNFAVET